MQVIGSFVSPYVRKVLACLELKGLDYEVDPITPFFGDDDFTRLSPLRRIPVLIDGEVTLSDSSVICAYLDEAYPEPPLLPASLADRARARWLEEYADTRLGDLLIWGLFYQRYVHPRVWGEPGDEARVERVLAEELPAALDYLEGQVPESGFLFGMIGLADVSLASFFRNAAYMGVEVEPEKWPRMAKFVQAVLEHPVLEKLGRYEAVQLETTIAGRRQALLDAGARLTEQSVGQRVPRKGLMPL